MIRNRFLSLATLSCLLGIMLLLSGCASMTSEEEDSRHATDAISRNTPYFPTKFNDFEVPGDLEMQRDDTMFINTASFVGGIVHFKGRLKAESLTDYFISTMQKNGWKLNGEVRYQNILLAFSKPTKNCMITIYQGEHGFKTKVYVYITEDVTTP